MQQAISIRNISPNSSFLQKLGIWFLDRLLGIKKMDTLYRQHNMQGLSKEDFSDRLIDVLQLDIQGREELKSKIPKTGPVVIASNHPFGGIDNIPGPTIQIFIFNSKVNFCLFFVCSTRFREIVNKYFKDKDESLNKNSKSLNG